MPRVLGDRYPIESRLGAGGMSIVDAAHDIHLGRSGRHEARGSTPRLGRPAGELERQAQAPAKLRNPSIATVHDIGAIGDRLCGGQSRCSVLEGVPSPHMGDRDGTETATKGQLVVGSGPAKDDAEPLPTVLGNRYQIEGRLGSGGMGVVYAARDIHLDRRVAVKVVGPRIDPGSGQERLVHEAQAMAKFRHPNIVRPEVESTSNGSPGSGRATARV